MSTRLHALIVAGALLLTAFAHSVAAQTLDQLASALGTASPLVVTGRVVAQEARWDSTAGAIYTYVTVSVTERLKGALSESTIVIKQLGGQVGDIGLKISDQASYAVGEDVLVFLAVRPRDGTLYPAGFQLGKWSLLPDLSTGRTHAVPATSVSASLAGPATAMPSLGLDLAAVRDIVAATPAVDKTFVTTPPETRLAAPSFALLPTGGNPARWHQVDDDADVLVDSQTPPGGVPGGQNELNTAMALWSNGETRLTLRFGNAGPVPGTCYGFNPQADRRIWVFYNDPCNEIADDGVTFGFGGGFVTGGDRRTVNGTEFDAFIQGVAVLNNAGPHMSSVGCFQDALTHTVGHAVGLGHTDSVGAIMRATLPTQCNDHGSGLGADDVSGLRFIYPATASGGSPPQPPTAFNYTAMLNTVTLNWTPATTGGPATSYIIEAGTGPGLTNITTLTVSAPQTSLVVNGVPQGAYYVRVRARNVLGTSGPSPEKAVIVGTCTAPNTPASLTTNVVDQSVSLFWSPPVGGAVQGYTLSAGSAPGFSDILVAPFPATTTSVAAIAPFGDYYVRVAATNVCGASAPTSPDQLVHVQPCAAPPNPPTTLTFVKNGTQITLNWVAPASGPGPSQYIIVGGSASGAADLLVYPTGNGATSISGVAPSGMYFFRVLAANACGQSAFTNEVHVVVP